MSIAARQPDASASPDAPVQDTDLDAILREFGPSQEQQRIDQLTGELNSVRAAEIERQSRQDFEGFSRKLQSDLGPNVPDDYARTQLLSMAVENPALEHAWRFRHITDEQLRAADREF